MRCIDVFDKFTSWAISSKGASTLCSIAEWGVATQQKLLSICRKINHIHIKKEFFANYISVYRNCGTRNVYTSYATPKIMSHYSGRQILAQQTFDKTDILLIEFSYCAAFCNMPRHTETVPKPRCIDIYTIFGICRAAKPHFVAFCCVAKCGRT